MKKNLMIGAVVFAAVSMLFGMAHAGAQDAEDDPGDVAAGEAVYAANCAVCHGDDGAGTSVGRPLTDIAQQGDRATHFASVSGGKGSMPAFEGGLSVDDIDAALSYVRLSFVSDADAAETDEESADAELAETGAETPLVALAGLTLIAAGGLLVHTARRDD